MKPVAKITGITLISSALFVVACSRDQGMNAAQEERVLPHAASREAPGRDRAASHDQGLPLGVVLPFRYSIRADRVLRREERGDVRRVDLEYLEGSQDSVYAQATQAVEAAGFEPHNSSVTGNGYLRASFRKPGYGPLVLIVTPDMGSMTARDPGALGRVVFELPPPRNN